MRTAFALILSALAALAASAAEPAAPVAIEFDGEAYRFVAREAAEARTAEHYLREGETLERFSRRLTIADQPKAASAKSVALGVLNIAKQRTPGLAPETFSAEGTQEHDLSIAWYDLTDDGSAVEHHIARFVDLGGGGVREYHLTLRHYTNGKPPDGAFGELRRAVEPDTVHQVELLSALDRAPQHPVDDKKKEKK